MNILRQGIGVMLLAGFTATGVLAQFREPYGANPDPITPHEISPDPWNRGLRSSTIPEADRDEPPLVDPVMPVFKAPDPRMDPEPVTFFAPLEYRGQSRPPRRSLHRSRRARRLHEDDDDD